MSEDVIGHEREAGVRELLPGRDQREDRQACARWNVRQAEAGKRGVDHLPVEVRIRVMVDAARLSGTP